MILKSWNLSNLDFIDKSLSYFIPDTAVTPYIVVCQTGGPSPLNDVVMVSAEPVLIQPQSGWLIAEDWLALAGKYVIVIDDKLTAIHNA
jgi:hypothetical protein